MIKGITRTAFRVLCFLILMCLVQAKPVDGYYRKLYQENDLIYIFRVQLDKSGKKIVVIDKMLKGGEKEKGDNVSDGFALSAFEVGDVGICFSKVLNAQADAVKKTIEVFDSEGKIYQIITTEEGFQILSMSKEGLIKLYGNLNKENQ